MYSCRRSAAERGSGDSYRGYPPPDVDLLSLRRLPRSGLFFHEERNRRHRCGVVHTSAPAGSPHRWHKGAGSAQWSHLEGADGVLPRCCLCHLTAYNRSRWGEFAVQEAEGHHFSLHKRKEKTCRTGISDKMLVHMPCLSAQWVTTAPVDTNTCYRHGSKGQFAV